MEQNEDKLMITQEPSTGSEDSTLKLKQNTKFVNTWDRATGDLWEMDAEYSCQIILGFDFILIESKLYFRLYKPLQNF